MTDTVAKHTPGPWAPLKHRNNIDFVVTAPAGDAELGTWMIADQVRWEANARLIAAAPDLLEALVETTNALDRELDGGIALVSDWGGYEMVRRARAAIAKATGAP